MPTVITLGNSSAKAYGFSSAPKDSYWILKLNSGANFRAVVADSNNNVYWAGTADSQDAGVGKYTTLGVNTLYARTGTTFYTPLPVTVGIDSSNNIYFAGTYNTGGGTTYPAFTKLNSSGAHQFSYYFSNTQQSIYTMSSATDTNGDTLIVGNEYLYAYFIKMTSAGTQAFSYRYGGSSASFESVKIQGSNYYLFGYPAGGTTGGFLTVKTDTSGNIVWQKCLTTSSPDTQYPRGYGGCVDPSGNTYIFGHARNASNSSIEDLYFYKCDSSGNLVWSKKTTRYSSGGYQGSKAYVAMAPNGNIYLATRYDTGSVWVTRILCVSSDGNIIWCNELFPTGSSSEPTDLTVDLRNNVYVTISNALFKLPADGSLTGVYSGYTYQQSYDSSSTVALPTGSTSSMSSYSYNRNEIVNMTDKTPSISTTLVNL